MGCSQILPTFQECILYKSPQSPWELFVTLLFLALFLTHLLSLRPLIQNVSGNLFLFLVYTLLDHPVSMTPVSCGASAPGSASLFSTGPPMPPSPAISYVRSGSGSNDFSSPVWRNAQNHHAAGSAATVLGIISDAFLNSGVKVAGRHHGSHSPRHSLATAMLGDGTGMFDIFQCDFITNIAHNQSQYNLVMVHIRILSSLPLIL